MAGDNKPFAHSFLHSVSRSSATNKILDFTNKECILTSAIRMHAPPLCIIFYACRYEFTKHLKAFRCHKITFYGSSEQPQHPNAIRKLNNFFFFQMKIWIWLLRGDRMQRRITEAMILNFESTNFCMSALHMILLAFATSSVSNIGIMIFRLHFINIYEKY